MVQGREFIELQASDRNGRDRNGICNESLLTLVSATVSTKIEPANISRSDGPLTGTGYTVKDRA